jgi:hypothetical protein
MLRSREYKIKTWVVVKVSSFYNHMITQILTRLDIHLKVMRSIIREIMEERLKNT